MPIATWDQKPIENIRVEQLDIKPGEFKGEWIKGGPLQQFSSTGIIDKASKVSLTVVDGCIVVDTINTKAVTGDVTFAGDTTGAFGNDNGESLRINWWLAAGSNFTSGTLATSWVTTVNANRVVGNVNLADSTSNDWYLTGVQLEVGEYDSTTIPPFQHEALQDSFFRCQRYYQNQGNNFYGMTEGTTFFRLQVPFDRPMRVSPSITARGVGFKFNARYLGDYTTDNPSIASAASTTFGAWLGVSGTGLTGNIPIYGRSQQDAAGQFLALSAEL